MVERNRIAVIPARSGSKRIPGKNIIDFNGRPMIAWTIDAARESQLFDRIVVSTDDDRIASVARDCGVEVPFLRDDFADDHTPVSDATLHALEQSERHFGESYQSVCQLMANCPIRAADDIVDAYRAFDESDADFQISCFRFGWMNPWWAVRLDDVSRPTWLFPEIIGKRSQDLDELYCPTGAIWLAATQPLKQAGTFYGPDFRFHPLNWQSALDIDDKNDLEMAAVVASLTAKR